MQDDYQDQIRCANMGIDNATNTPVPNTKQSKLKEEIRPLNPDTKQLKVREEIRPLNTCIRTRWLRSKIDEPFKDNVRPTKTVDENTYQYGYERPERDVERRIMRVWIVLQLRKTISHSGEKA